jgi:hypothetical protein
MIIAEFLKIIKTDFEENIKKNGSRNFPDMIENHKKIIEMHETLNQLYAPIIIERYISVALSISSLGFEIFTVVSLINADFLNIIWDFLYIDSCMTSRPKLIGYFI